MQYKRKRYKLKKRKKTKRIKGTSFFRLAFLRNPAKVFSAWRKSYH